MGNNNMKEKEKIIKLSVARGIFWVEIPDADLRVLCGCPMDCIKHLMKQKLIINTEINGVPCETGPNAILLSDVMLQNGEFSNLGEFPVLQMLYKQGLILPNHPNNTGEKPLLIGQAEQVNAQMQYIYRGNYGLISKEEIMKAGVDEKTAEEMIRLKLKFAFGAIRSTDSLLNSCIVENDDTHIRNDVTIRRKSINVYEFSYQGSTTSVNLNLGAEDSYESAYPLGFQHLEREYFSVVHSGEGDGWDVNRPSMSSILMFQGKIYLIDAGPNLSYNLLALGIGINEIEGIFQTHAHDDHLAGITTLMRSGHKIKYYSTPIVRATVEKKIAALLSVEEDRFEDFFDIQDLPAEVWSNVEGLEVKPIFSPHPLETTIFMFRTPWGDGYKSYAHFADIIAFDVLEGMIEEDSAKPGITRDYFDRIKSQYLLPANLKKLDIGGGMIHGEAKDFKEDKSDRILLSHIPRELTNAEKEIGSNAPYGMMDVLISSQSDLARRKAFSFLLNALPNIALHDIRILINNPVIDFNPGVVVLKEGEIPEYILLILTGAVEKIRTKENLYSQLSSGAVVGELSGLYGRPAKSTYSTACFARALKIPVTLYRNLVERNNLMSTIEQTWEKRDFLETTCVFAEGVPYQVVGQIVDSIQVRHYTAGEVISCKDLTLLNVIKAGKVSRSLGGKIVDTLKAKDYFGEEGAVFDTPCLFHLEAMEPVEVFQVPGDLLKDIPIVRWKLYEAYLKRATQVVHDADDLNSIRWNSGFDIKVMEMDIHHKKLVEIANCIAENMRYSKDRKSLEKAVDSLVDYTEYHFSAEERLMEMYGYPAFKDHKEKHQGLVSQVMYFQGEVNRGSDLTKMDFHSFFVNWLIKHILSEDQKYADFLHSKGIY
jgi:hemerythrin